MSHSPSHREFKTNRRMSRRVVPHPFLLLSTQFDLFSLGEPNVTSTYLQPRNSWNQVASHHGPKCPNYSVAEANCPGLRPFDAAGRIGFRPGGAGSFMPGGGGSLALPSAPDRPGGGGSLASPAPTTHTTGPLLITVSSSTSSYSCTARCLEM